MKVRLDAARITNYNATEEELQRLIVFWILAAGKNGTVAARNIYTLETMLGSRGKIFNAIKRHENNLSDIMHKCGIGCYNKKAETLLTLAKSKLDLRKCSVQDLETISGIGRKTSRCFVIHTRRDAWYAGLDTHALKFLRSKGYEAPKVTPSSQKKYDQLEQLFLKFVPKGMTAGEFDLINWNNYKVAVKC